jgi:hypothetical protein
MSSRFLLAVALMTMPALTAWAPPESASHDLAEGKPFSEVAPAADGAVLIHAAIDIAAPPKVIWEVMHDCRYAQKLVTTVTLCRILQSDPAHDFDIRETVTHGNFFVPTISNIVREDYQPYQLVKFRKVGGNLKVEEGEWRLIPLQGGVTRVTYENLVGADILAPAPLVREGMKRDTAKVLVNLQRESVSIAH